MAGRNHHIIPQMLLKGFSEEINQNQFQITAYCKDGRSFPVNIRKIAVERDFYWKDIDARITDLEKDWLDCILKKMLAQDPDKIVDSQEASRFVSHLICRNAEIKNQFCLLFEKLVDKIIEEKIFNESFLLKLLGFYDSNSPLSQIALHDFHAKFSKGLRWIPFPTFVIDWLVLFALRFVIFKELIKHPILKKKEIETIAKNAMYKGCLEGFNKTLEKSLCPEKYIEALSKLNWSIERGPKEGATLPDCVALFKTKGGEWESPFDVKISEVCAVYLPIATSKILVGTADAKRFSLQNINRYTAVNSLNYFFASSETSVKRHVTKLIGVKAEKATAKFIDSKLKEIREIPNCIIKGVHETFKDFDLKKIIEESNDKASQK